jgi:hypothetical protein
MQIPFPGPDAATPGWGMIGRLLLFDETAIGSSNEIGELA